MVDVSVIESIFDRDISQLKQQKALIYVAQ